MNQSRTNGNQNVTRKRSSDYDTPNQTSPCQVEPSRRPTYPARGGKGVLPADSELEAEDDSPMR
jgi:hypothetical protein